MSQVNQSVSNELLRNVAKGNISSDHLAKRDDLIIELIEQVKNLCKTLSATPVISNKKVVSEEKVKCSALTKAKKQCSKAAVIGEFCTVHSRMAIVKASSSDTEKVKCSATTKAGKQCSKTVKEKGDKCFVHKSIIEPSEVIESSEFTIDQIISDISDDEQDIEEPLTFLIEKTE